MAEIDQIAAAKASLEFLVQENQQMLDRFQELSQKLDEIGKMASPSRQDQFRQLEQSGAFLLNEIDLRHFSETSKQSLTPSQFVQSTRRRLHNTCFLIDKLIARSTFEEGPQLRDVLLGLTSENFNPTEPQAVNDYKNMVEMVQKSDLFQKYLQVKKTFIQQNSKLKTEEDFLAAQELVADGINLCRNRAAELKTIYSFPDSDMTSDKVPFNEWKAKYKQLMAQLGFAVQDEEFDKKRKHPRFKFNTPEKTILIQIKNLPCALNDISVGGLSFFSNLKFDINRNLLLEFDRKFDVKAHIIRVTLEAESSSDYEKCYFHGAKFFNDEDGYKCIVLVLEYLVEILRLNQT
ncbi:MAG: PilZ domain-containing protein [SAR324 cluster bacterium]|nr:PilZ domain-containing protein [SAR324 cluster bacterium]